MQKLKLDVSVYLRENGTLRITFFVAGKHDLFLFASLVLSTMIPEWEMTSKYTDLLNLVITLRKLKAIPLIGIFAHSK